MRSHYKPLGKYIKQVKARNGNDLDLPLKGISINKEFMPSVANVNGTDLSKYRVVTKGQFAYNPMHVGRDEVLPISLLQDNEKVTVSPAYVVFEVINPEELLPEYLMMWFRRSEFDRNAWFTTDSSVRGGFSWDDFCAMELPIPSPEKQREIVAEYNTIVNRIKLNEQLCQTLEETAQTLYKHWFVDFEFPMPEEYAQSIGKQELAGHPYKSSGGVMEFNKELERHIPIDWSDGTLAIHATVLMGQSPDGETYNTEGIGVPLINGPVEFGEYFPEKSKWTTAPTKLSRTNDLIVCVRGATTGRFVKSDGEYCLGRGACSIRAKHSQYYTDQLFKQCTRAMLNDATGTTFENWGRDTIQDFPVIVPAKEIIIKFENVVSPLFRKVQNTFVEQRLLHKLKNTVLSEISNVRHNTKLTV